MDSTTVKLHFNTEALACHRFVRHQREAPLLSPLAAPLAQADLPNRAGRSIKDCSDFTLLRNKLDYLLPEYFM